MEIPETLDELSPGSGHRWQIFELWPKLKPYDNIIHVVYSGYGPVMNFHKRDIENLVEEVNMALKFGKIKFIFNNISEGIMPECIEKIHTIIKLCKLLPKNVFYATASLDGQEVYDRLSREYQWNIPITIMSCNLFQFGMSRQWNKNFKEYIIKLKDKKFVCFNNVPRKHRLKLLERMLDSGLINNSYYSFEGNRHLKNSLKSTEEFPCIKKNLDLIPLRLNITEDRKNPIDIIEEDYIYHDNSYFSVITETLFYKDFAEGLFISEKTYRPIAMQHPFIVLGPAGLIAELKKWGYKTFEPFINESYDSIIDNDLRFNAVIAEIERLCLFTDNEWLEWQSHIKNIVEFNKQHFFSTTKHQISTDIEQYFK